MADASPSTIFNQGLLDGLVAVVAGDGAVAGSLRSLGADVAEPDGVDLRDAEAVDAFVDGVVAERGGIGLLVNRVQGPDGADADGDLSAEAFHDYLDARVQGAWHLCHAVAAKAFIPAEAGKLIAIAAPPGEGPGTAPANAVTAAVENMTRTLSIEWARFGITTTSISASPSQAADDVASVVAFLASPAGDFHSGGVISLS